MVDLALSYLLVALSLLYSTISGECQGAQWFIWVPILINLAFTVAMIWLITKQAMPGVNSPRTSHIYSMAIRFAGEEGDDNPVTSSRCASPVGSLGGSHKAILQAM